MHKTSIVMLTYRANALVLARLFVLTELTLVLQFLILQFLILQFLVLQFFFSSFIQGPKLICSFQVWCNKHQSEQDSPLLQVVLLLREPGMLLEVLAAGVHCWPMSTLCSPACPGPLNTDVSRP